MSRPFDTLSLLHFIAVCEEGSIARAAARESLVPSALSKRLAALELDLGVRLLVRQRRGVVPTSAGEALLGRAREIVGAVDRARVELGAFSEGAQGSVRILASPSVLAEQLPEDISAFLSRHPHLRVTLDERVSPEIVRGLREGAADLGVLWDQGDLIGLQCLPYRSDHLCVAMAAGHALATQPSLSFADIVDQITINVAPGGLMDLMLRRQTARLGGTSRYRMQVSSMDATCRLVAAGLGLSVLPREVAAAHALVAGLALVPLADAWALRQFVIASRPEPLLSASAKLLAVHLTQASTRP